MIEIGDTSRGHLLELLLSNGILDYQPLSKFEVICNVILISFPYGDEV